MHAELAGGLDGGTYIHVPANSICGSSRLEDFDPLVIIQLEVILSYITVLPETAAYQPLQAANLLKKTATPRWYLP